MARTVCMECVALKKDVVTGINWCELYSEECRFSDEACEFYSTTEDELNEKLDGKYEEQMTDECSEV